MPVLQHDGSWRRMEVPGVPDMTQWLVAWELFKAVLIMLDAVTLCTLEAYQRKIEGYARLYQREWHVVVEAEDYLRQVHFRVLARLHPLPQGVVPRQRWDIIFREALKDNDFWDEHIFQKVLAFKRGLLI